MTFIGRPANAFFAVREAIPLPKSTTTFKFLKFFFFTKERQVFANSFKRFFFRTLPRFFAFGKMFFSTSDFIFSRPVSIPIGEHFFPTILKPLYCFGLCEAVTITPAGRFCFAVQK